MDDKSKEMLKPVEEYTELFDKANLNFLVGSIEKFFTEMKDELRQQRNLIRLLSIHHGVDIRNWGALEEKAKQ